MVEIQSKEVIDKISDELKIQPALIIPRELMDKIQLVYNINSPNRDSIIRSVSRSTTGSSTLFTTSATRPFFLTSATLVNQSDVTADNTAISLVATPFGQATINPILLNKLTTTVFSGQISQRYDPPILLARSSSITLGSTFTVGASISGASITGFETDPQ